MMTAVQSSVVAPHCDAIHAAHIARVTLETLAGRPLSHANTPFIDACLRSLEMLASRLDLVRDRLAAPHDGQAGEVAGILRRVAANPAANVIRDAGHYIRESFTLYARLMQVSLPQMPAQPDPLHDARPVAAVVIIGPGLGIGDEIKLRDVLKQLQAHFAIAAAGMYVFSYCPAIWRTLESDWHVEDLSQRPMAAFDRLAALRAATAPGAVIVGFCNFLRRNALRTMLPYESSHDVLDISVGSGEISIRRRGERTELNWCAMQNDTPCLSRALLRIGEHVLPRGAPATVPRARRVRGTDADADVFRILLSPFTSKLSPLTAHDWADYVASLVRALPTRRRVQCRVLPGLTPACEAHAVDIARLVAYQLHDRGHAELAHAPDLSWTAENAISHISRELAQTDLLFGIDTYTAHLAAEIGTASIALCLEHNPRFWAPSPWTFWLNLQTGDHMVLPCARAVVRLLDGSSRAGLPFTGTAHAAALLARAGGLSGVDAARLLDDAWQALPSRVQQSLERLDDQFAWPRWRGRFADASMAQRRTLLRSNFLRLLALAEPSLWTHDDYAAG